MGVLRDNIVFAAVLTGRKGGFVFETGAKILEVVETATVADLFDGHRSGLK